MQAISISLEVLSAQIAALLDSGQITQETLAVQANVDQGLISRLKNRKLRRVTPRVRRIWKYVNQKIAPPSAGRKIDDAIKGYLQAGGDPQKLRRQIDLLRDVLDDVRRNPRNPQHENRAKR